MIQETPNKNLLDYLVHSYIRQYVSASHISDKEYAELVKKVIENWGDITHPCKKLIDFDKLKNDPAYCIEEDKYPAVVKGLAAALTEIGAIGA